MHLPVLGSDTEVPDCFSKLWDSAAVECAGDGSATPQCPLFGECGRATQVRRVTEEVTRQKTEEEVQPAHLVPTLAEGVVSRLGVIVQREDGTYGPMGYLAVPEPRLADDTVWSILGRELARTVLKASGQTVAHVMDTCTLRKPPPPKDET